MTVIISVSLRYENRFSEKWKLKASGKFNYSWNKDTDKKAAGPTEDRFRQTETYLTATLWAKPVKNLSFSLAQDFVYKRFGHDVGPMPIPGTLYQSDGLFSTIPSTAVSGDGFLAEYFHYRTSFFRDGCRRP